MTEKELKEQTSKPSQKPANENAGSDELSEQYLDKAAGGTTVGSATGAGKTSLNEFSF